MNPNEVSLQEALATKVSNEKTGWTTRIIFRCERCKKPQEYPDSAEGDPLIMCCYCPSYNLIDKVTIKMMMK